MNGSDFLEFFLKVLFLPVLNTFVQFSWGAEDPTALGIAKRVFILLPVLAIILGYWVSIVSVLTVLIRSDRGMFLTSVFVTWWDLGRAIFAFWGGILKFVLTLVISLFSVLRLLIVGLWVLIQDIVLIPFRVVGNIGENILNPGVPWIAVSLTLFWCVFEAIIFTYVTSPLVIDTLSNMTGNQMSEAFIRTPLFLFMLFIVLGSYSVLSTWTQAVKTRNIASIIKIGAIEAVALFVEVVFLYREFVDALVPWFAQHSSGHFELGIAGTLLIAGATWFGIRSLSWFLFASTGTPTIMAIIQGSGLKMQKSSADGSAARGSFSLTVGLVTCIKNEIDWVGTKGDELVGAFILPPLQVIAAALNFCTLLVTTKHLFELPIRSVAELKDARTLLARFEETPRRKKNGGE